MSVDVVSYLIGQEEKDKLIKKRDRIDYDEIIDLCKLGKKYFQFCYCYKKQHPRCKSKRKLQYLFLKHCKIDFDYWLKRQFSLEEAIRIAKTPWLDED